METKLVGISFNPTQTKEHPIDIDTKLTVYHDADNKYSDKAIAVKFGDKLIGHVAEKNNPDHEKIFKELPLEASVCRIAVLQEGEEFTGGGYEFKPGEITSISIEFDMPEDEEKTYSFTEPSEEIVFDPIRHKYTHKGKELVGCSTYVKKWLPEFDKKYMSSVCAKAWGVPQEELYKMWEANGEMAATFGTAIHKALENYYRFKNLGAIIQEAKKEEINRALPKHPVLKQIVAEFIDEFSTENILIPECIVTNLERGLSGTIDAIEVLDSEKKTCRILDYKINVGCEEEDVRNKFSGIFAELPPNKLSEYQIKMSYYARLMELAGWTVEGLDAFVYDGEWKRYPMEVLKMDF